MSLNKKKYSFQQDFKQPTSVRFNEQNLFETVSVESFY